MMQFFRATAKPIILIVTIAFFTWLVYDLSGLGGGSGLLTQTSVGRVNGTSVDARTFDQAVQEAVQVRQTQSGVPLSLDDISQIRDQVWEQFVQDIIFRAEYEKRGIRTSPEEVAEAIRNSPPREFQENPDFQTDGRFDLGKYQRWLGSVQGQQYVPIFETRYRDEILRGKLVRSVIADVYLSDAALWERYRDEHESVRIGLLTVRPAAGEGGAAPPVSDAELEAYYREHRDAFRRDRAAWLSYVMIPRLPDASDSAAALARTRALREEIRAGAPFAEVARRESADTVSGSQGGDLGEQSRATVDSAFGRAAMTLPLNSLSEPVRSGFGFHLIEVQSRRGDRFKARHILVPIEVTGEHRDRLDARADSLESLGADRLDRAALDTVASALGLSIQRIGPVAERSRVFVPGAGMVPDAGVWAFQAEPGEHSPVVEAPTAYFVFRLDSARSAGVAPLEQIREEVRSRVVQHKRLQQARETGTGLAQRAREGAPLRELASDSAVRYEELGPFARLTAPLPDPILIGAAFGVSRGEIAGPVATPEAVYLLEGIQRTPADSGAFVRDLASIREQALTAARQGRVRAYFAALRQSAAIVDRRAELYRTSAQSEQQAQVPIGY